MARNDLWTDFCPQFLYNTSYNSTLFNDDNFRQENVSLYYQCDTSAPWIPLTANYQISCIVNNSRSDGYFYLTNFIDPNMANFFSTRQNHIDVLVSQYSAARLATTTTTTYDLRSALRAGFNLQWIDRNIACGRCMQSGGLCGSNSSSPELFACYCGSGDFPLTCDNIDRNGVSPAPNSLDITPEPPSRVSTATPPQLFLLQPSICCSTPPNQKSKILDPQSASADPRVFL
ncbi:hypothetical protein L1887_35948 [Cichorium endivia]|nr:hypothetical protein L1887_35948 [Cichorium endivia]